MNRPTRFGLTLAGCLAACAAWAADAVKAEVLFRADFGSAATPFQSEGAAMIDIPAVMDEPRGRSLTIQRAKPGGYFGARTQSISIDGSRQLKVAFCVKAKGMKTVTLNLYDALPKDNTTAASAARIVDEQWRTCVFAVDDFHYNSSPPQQKIKAETQFRAMLLHGTEVEGQQGIFSIRKLVVYRGQDTQPPQPPARVEAIVAKDNSVMIAWDEPDDDVAAVIYSVYRKVGDQAWEKIGESFHRQFRDKPPAGRPLYRVTAADYDNNSSKPSNDAHVDVKQLSVTKVSETSLPEQDRLRYAAHVRKVHAAGRGCVRPDTFLFAGDSITAADAYTFALGGWLGRGTTIRKGVGTVRTEYGRNQIGRYLDEHHPEFAIIMYGTNDSKEPQAVAAAMENLAAIVDACTASGTVPILATIPPRGFDKDKQAGQERYNTALITLCREKRVPISSCFEEMIERELKSVLSDGVHLTPGAGNEAAGEALWKTFQQIGFALRDASEAWQD